MGEEDADIRLENERSFYARRICFLQSELQKSVGLSKAKAWVIVDLARHYQRGDLSDEFSKESSSQKYAVPQFK